MKVWLIWLSSLVSVLLPGATSEILFANHTASFAGAPGNVVFDGQQFVAPVVRSNGVIDLLRFDTNGLSLPAMSLSITGGSPRVACYGSNVLLAWLGDVGLSVLKCAVWSNGVPGAPYLLATNVAAESVAISGRQAPFLVVWQSAESPSAIYGRKVTADGSPLADVAQVSPSAQSQAFPSAVSDGTNHLVCWMEQNTGGVECDGSNYWRAVAQRLTNGLPNGTAWTVSQTNSFRPYPTACAFGTNYLVVWSSDHKFPPYADAPCGEVQFQPAVHGRRFLDSPIAEEFVVAAEGPSYGDYYFGNTNSAVTNATVAFGAGRFLVAYPHRENWQQTQPLALDGSMVEFAIIGPRIHQIDSARVGYGVGRFCVLYGSYSANSQVAVIGPASITEPRLLNVRRNAAGGVSLSVSTNSGFRLEGSINLTNWTYYSDIVTTNLPRLFVRATWDTWVCTERLRALNWAKLRWAFDGRRYSYDEPTQLELQAYLHQSSLGDFPTCPANGTYWLRRVDEKPTCSVATHTL